MIISVANHQSVLPIFSLTVVSLCILLNLYTLSSQIVAVRPLESASQENYFPFLNPLNLPSSIVVFSCLKFILHISPPFLQDFNNFTSTSLAKHQSVLPIFSLTVVLTCSYRERWSSHRSIASGYCVVLLPWDFILFFCSVLWHHSLANSGQPSPPSPMSRRVFPYSV
jgi:hypothetical protein